MYTKLLLITFKDGCCQQGIKLIATNCFNNSVLDSQIFETSGCYELIVVVTGTEKAVEAFSKWVGGLYQIDKMETPEIIKTQRITGEKNCIGSK